jgi:hypothetical protein
MKCNPETRQMIKQINTSEVESLSLVKAIVDEWTKIAMRVKRSQAEIDLKHLNQHLTRSRNLVSAIDTILDELGDS